MNAMKLQSLMTVMTVMSALQRLRRPPLFGGLGATKSGVVAAVAGDAVEPIVEGDDAPRACGWFDSSHDLQHGLRVQEHVSPDSLARELPLGAWLDLQLSGWRASTPVAAPARFTAAT